MRAQWRKWSLHLKRDHTKTKSYGSSFQTIQRSKALFFWTLHSSYVLCLLFLFCFLFVLPALVFVICVRSSRTAHMFGKSLERLIRLRVSGTRRHTAGSARGKDRSVTLWRSSCIGSLSFFCLGYTQTFLSPTVKYTSMCVVFLSREAHLSETKESRILYWGQVM